MTKFNKKSSVTKTRNLAGGIALKMSKEMELIHAVLSTFLDDKYYESAQDRMDRLAGLVAMNDPQFVGNLAVIARKEFHLRSVTTLLLGEIAKSHSGSTVFSLKDTIVGASERVDDLMELAAYSGTPLPKQIKRGIRNALLKFNRYQLAKYKGEGKDVSLVDLFNLVHPKVQHASPEQKKAWEDLMAGNLKSFDTWEVEVSAAKDEDEKQEAWESLILENKMGYMAMIRNLNNFIKNKISDKAVKKVIAKLTDPEEVKRSKQLPFRFMTAYTNVKGSRVYSDAISEAMDLAVSNVPKFDGKVLIAIDDSGSMDGAIFEKAAIFAATLMKANRLADVIIFDTNYREVTLSSRTPVVDLTEAIKKMYSGGGTDTSKVFEYATKKGVVYDRIIIISDNESWQDSFHNWSNDGRGTNSTYNAYKKALNADPYVYAIDMQGYGTKDLSGGRVFHLAGWSERLLDFMGVAEKGESLVDYVRNYKIELPEKAPQKKRVVKKKVDKKSKKK